MICTEGANSGSICFSAKRIGDHVIKLQAITRLAPLFTGQTHKLALAFRSFKHASFQINWNKARRPHLAALRPRLRKSASEIFPVTLLLVIQRLLVF